MKNWNKSATELALGAMILAGTLGLGVSALIAADEKPAKATESAAEQETEKATAKAMTADEAWKAINKLQFQAPPKASPMTQAENMKFFTEKAKKLTVAANDFAKQFPDDPRRWEAHMIAIERSPAPKSGSDTEKLLKEISQAKDATESVQGRARLRLVSLHRMALTPASDPKAVEAVDNEMQAFAKDFPKHPAVATLTLQRAELWMGYDQDKARTLFEELAAGDDKRMAPMAKAKLKQLDLMKKPFELKFTAVDGREVDMSKLRGKVVLIDFWATWCGPCIVEIPNVVATYNKLHDKGFEIVGISLDNENAKEKLISFTKEKNMPWVQHFDGKGWKNEISSGYGINSIPAMWLVNKKGMLVSLNARANLAAQVEKLLAE